MLIRIRTLPMAVSSSLEINSLWELEILSISGSLILERLLLCTLLSRQSIPRSPLNIWELPPWDRSVEL